MIIEAQLARMARFHFTPDKKDQDQQNHIFRRQAVVKHRNHLGASNSGARYGGGDFEEGELDRERLYI